MPDPTDVMIAAFARRHEHRPAAQASPSGQDGLICARRLPRVAQLSARAESLGIPPPGRALSRKVRALNLGRALTYGGERCTPQVRLNRLHKATGGVVSLSERKVST